MAMLSRRAVLASAGAAAVVAGLPAGTSVPVATVTKAMKPPLPTWIVGTPGEWDHEIIRAATRELAVRLRCDDCEGEDDEDFAGPDGCECEPCLARGGYEATRVPQWDGRNSINSGDWLDIGQEALCSRCDYETAKEMGGHNVGGKAVCEDCMTLADWDIVDPERAAEIREEMADV